MPATVWQPLAREADEHGAGERVVRVRGDARGEGDLPGRPELHDGGGGGGAVAGGHRQAQQVAALLRGQPHQ